MGQISERLLYIIYTPVAPFTKWFNFNFSIDK